MRLATLLTTAGVAVATACPALATPTQVLFVGNSYTFGRADPVMSYNAAAVNDLTHAMWLNNPSGSNAFEPHPWGGVAGIFKQFTVQTHLDYDVSLSARNAASLRGQLLNTNAAGWDLRSNIGAKAWDKVVLQEQSDEALIRRVGLASNPEYTRVYTDKIEDFIHQGLAHSYRERDLIGGSQAACVALGYSAGTCSSQRSLPANANANAAAQVYLYQTWARPNLVNGAFVTSTDTTTGAVTRSATPATTFFADLEGMTEELRLAYEQTRDLADDDGTGGITGIAPVGQAFLRAVQQGVATRDMWAADAKSDGLIDLWFEDGTHASTHGSYLSALTLFGQLTGLNPMLLGAHEQAAFDLGIAPAEALVLQRIASEQLGFAPAVPEPGTALLMAAGLLALIVRARKA